MPNRRGSSQDEAAFRKQFQEVQEALALLVAVEHADYHAYDYILAHWSGVIRGRFGEELNAVCFERKFLLDLDVAKYENQTGVEAIAYDLVRFCGTRQREHPGEEYLSALRQIAALDKNLKPGEPGVDIKIPVKLQFSSHMSGMPAWNSRNDAKILVGVAEAEKEIETQWTTYNGGEEKKALEPGTLRCTFVLEPMAAEFDAFGSRTEFDGLLLLKNGVWFSFLDITLSIDRTGRGHELEARKSLGFLLTHLLTSKRHDPKHAHISYHLERPSIAQDPGFSQLKVLKLTCEATMPARDFEAMCSALVATRSTKKLALELDIDTEDPTNRNHWWKWLAYALFSKRARTCSTLKTLIIPELGRLTRVGGVLIAGFGRCQVQRCDLEFERESQANRSASGITSLTLGFPESHIATVLAVPPLIEAIGTSLKVLIVNGPKIVHPRNVDENAIIRSCPNLLELTLAREIIEVQLDFRDYRATKSPIPKLTFSWVSVPEFVGYLSDPENPLTKCARRLKVSLQTCTVPLEQLESGNAPSFRYYVDAIVSMLERNERLEYLSVESPYIRYFSDSGSFHHKPIFRQPKPLPKKCMLAFLSILESRTSTDSTERMEAQTSEAMVGDIDQHVVAKSFSFAALPVLREVYFESNQGLSCLWMNADNYSYKGDTAVSLMRTTEANEIVRDSFDVVIHVHIEQELHRHPHIASLNSTSMSEDKVIVCVFDCCQQQQCLFNFLELVPKRCFILARASTGWHGDPVNDVRGGPNMLASAVSRRQGVTNAGLQRSPPWR
ncbi:hypothetical protein PHYSODRAFT_306236 [Phytophthora sojae]|uniref:Uncharacterized protein n=1 Tax=Phytophthora sojae (strain P6497) TaxID=1094619 RepID=G5A8J7_PHYSP|nr:hypothetical protein PHYSODRAFT_306236 [Phytophthora sojae]EGZ08223.1 hypothetical protein PHYSODRAFT_306236 [Phytophthora sojae]|eukprot:XP_009536395.1 hypothetical protein PHYSODRAFT_306236 [Phytophthora sojae]